MKRSILVLFIISLFLTACGDSLENSAPLNETQVDNNQTDQTENTFKNNDIETNKEDNTDVDENTKVEETLATELEITNSDHDLSDLRVHYIDAGQADATLFQYTDDDQTYTILYDAGDWNNNDVVTYLSNQDISAIDLIIISHPHADHIGQLAPIVENFDVGEVWFSGNTSSSKTFQHAVDAVMSSNADYYEPRAGDVFDIGHIGVEILHPKTLTGNLNEDSISVRFTYGDINFLFTGDAYQNEELEMIEGKFDVAANILQLGHHGSRTSSHPAFIKAVDPDVAIYSAGKDNSYGHPHEEVVDRIETANIKLYGTDQDGTIIVTTDGRTYHITTQETAESKKQAVSTPKDKPDKQKTSEKDVNAKTERTKQQSTESDEKNITEASPEKADDNQKTSLNKNCVDLNNASFEALQDIIHIGPARAELIIEQRPFQTVDDLTKIKGIGPARIADIKSEGNACVN